MLVALFQEVNMELNCFQNIGSLELETDDIAKANVKANSYARVLKEVRRTDVSFMLYNTETKSILVS